MILLRRSSDRGHLDHGWLDTYHTFSFGDYRDQDFMGFRALRVINEDWVAPGTGFAEHPHRDMEIVTYVISGALAHADSMGNGSIIKAGELQRMSAGTGITHSERNPSKDETVHLLQIWLFPEQKGLEPGYEQQTLADVPSGTLTLVASRDGRDGSLTVRQDARLYLGRLQPGTELTHPFQPGRHGWLQVIRGELSTGELSFGPGDGAAISDERALTLSATSAAEFLLFDLA